jgi:hypothetical protein
MAKNNVGSLYYEILLNPDGYRKGAAKVRKEQSELSAFIKRDSKEVLTEREKARLEAEKLARANWSANKNDAVKRAALQKAIVRAYKRRIKEIEAAESAARVKSVLEEKKRMQQKKIAVINGMEKLIAEEKKAELKRLNTQRGRGGGPMGGNVMGGLGKAWEGFTGIAGKIGTVTMAIWPLTQAFNFLSRSVGRVVNVFMSWMKIIDEFKMSAKNMALQMGGDVKAANDLAKSVEAYAAKTSLSVQAGLDMANSLLVMGINADFVMVRLRQFNQVAQGNAEKFKRISKAYTDVVAAGTLKMTEVRQFTEAHVPIREFLQRVLEDQKRFTGDLDKMISDRLVTAQDVGKALDLMGERYKDADLFGLETVSGQLENISEEIMIWLRHSEAGVEVNKEFVEALKSISRLLPVVINGMTQMMEVTDGLGGGPLRKLNTTLRATEKLLKNVMALRSLFATGDLSTWQKEWDMAKKVMEQNERMREQDARAQADALDSSMARHNAEQKMAADYLAARKEIIKVEETAQSKYDDWVAKHNVDKMSAMDQSLLNGQYMAQQQADADQARQEKLDQLNESAAQRAASVLEKAINAALPQSAFKQNSVEEFRYLQQQRKQAERDRREQERFDQKMERDQDNADRQWEATMNIVTATDTATSI